MKFVPILTCTFTALLASMSSSFALSDGILANTATFTPKITFSDIYSESVDIEREDGFVTRSVVSEPQKVAIFVTANLANLDSFDPAAVAADTSVGVNVGNFDFFAELGDDPDYAPGKKQASFPYTKDVETASGDVRQANVGQVKVSWTDKVLTIRITCNDVEGAEIADIAASDHAGEADSGTEVDIENEQADVAVVFGDADGARTAFINGLTKTVTKTFGNPDSDNYDELDLVSVNLKASADVDGPVVKAANPVKPRIGQPGTINGLANDLSAMTFDSAKVNGVVLPPSAISLSAADVNGTANWSLSGFNYKKGNNLIEVSFSDEYGNVGSLNKRVVVSQK